jgi:hypothetical protein
MSPVGFLLVALLCPGTDPEAACTPIDTGRIFVSAAACEAEGGRQARQAADALKAAGWEPSWSCERTGEEA